jgi:hypothetical protein
MKGQMVRLFGLAVLLLQGLPLAVAQSPSCIQAWTSIAGNVQGIVSYNPVVYEPNNCIDQAHSIGSVVPLDNAGQPGDETGFHTSAPITSVSVSVDTQDNCNVTGINPTLTGSGLGQFSDFVGNNHGTIYFFYSPTSGVPMLDGFAHLTISITDNTGNGAVYAIEHTCPAPGGGTGGA